MLWVLVLSGLLGFRVGIVAFPDWQVAVETAQVVAGLVEYPTHNPFYLYHTKLWTILHQACALALRSGISEISLSLIVSGLVGMVSFQALSMCIYALSRDAVLAIGSAVAIFFSRAAEFGVVYPIYLMGTSHTYGVVGLSLIVLAAGLLGAGCYRLGGFLVGAAPAAHPSLGLWLALIVALSVAWSRKEIGEELRRARTFFVAGCAVTAISLAIQLVFVYDAPRIDEELTDRLLIAFVTFWDGHRRPVDFASEGVKLNFGALALALLWLTAFAEDVTTSARSLLRIVVVSAAVSLALAAVSWIPADALPMALVTLMPSRLLNFNGMIFVTLLIGLIGMYRKTIWSRLLMLFLLVGLLLSNRSMFWNWIEPQATGSARHIFPGIPTRPLQIFTMVLIVLLLCAGASTWSRRRAARTGAGPAEAGPASRAIGSAARWAMLGVLLWIGALSLQLTASRSSIFHDRTNDPIFRLMADTKGLLLTAGDLHLIQLRTRRPVLLDGGGLDGLPYAPEAGPEMQRILRDVYALDLLSPPEEARGLGVIPLALNRQVWERYSSEKWREIRQTYNVTQVLTYADWELHLPVVARNRTLSLYGIPE